MMERIANLIDVKSIVTITMTGALVALLFFGQNVNNDMLMIFSTAYGAVITYFFTRPKTN